MLSWRLSSSPGLPVGFFIQDKAMDKSHNQVDANKLASLTGNKEGRKGPMVLRVRPTPPRLPKKRYSPEANTPVHSTPSVRGP